jgi:hypothetical protein
MPELGIGIGVGDLQSAAARELARLLKEARGNRAKAVKSVLERLHALSIINDADLRSLTRMFELGFKAADANGSVARQYFDARQLYDEMLATGTSTSTALALAASSIGSYQTVSEGETGVIYKTSSTSYKQELAIAGAAIGGLFGQPAFGAIIGGTIGAIVDDCKD